MNEAPGQRLADQLTATERERRWPNVRPRNAATLIIIDRQASEPTVLMGRRHPGHKFMPGKFVFPGGRIETGDRKMAAHGALHSRIEAALSARVVKPSPHIGRALALAAIRETYEETGLMLGVKGEAAPDRVPELWDDFRARGVVPDLDSIRFIARAITPPRRPKRFDTRFFALDRSMIVEEAPGVVGPEAELIELAWVNLADARQLELPAITRVILEELENRLAAGFRHELPVPFYYEQRGRFLREEL